MRGIDISAGSGAVDFKALKGAGYEFVICRAGFGSKAKQVDKNFHSYVGDALQAGLHVGAYWFIYARDLEEAKENARVFADTIKCWSGRLDMPMYIDYEYDSTLYYEKQTGKKETRDQATNFIAEAAEIMENAGYYTGVYLNPDYLKNHIYPESLGQYTLWLAQWGVTSPSYDCGMWQRAGDTKIAEASGGVDLDECFRDFPTIIRRCGLNGFKKDIAPQANARNRSGDYWEIVDSGNEITIRLGGERT